MKVEFAIKDSANSRLSIVQFNKNDYGGVVGLLVIRQMFMDSFVI